MMLSKEEVPLLADDELDLPLIHSPWREKQAPPRSRSLLRYLTWKTLLWCILSISFGLLLVVFPFVRTRQPLVDFGISIRHPPTTLPGWPAKRNPAYQIHATHGAVATENILCSDMGVGVLKDGGNAVDASVAVTLCVGVVNMFRYHLAFPP